MSCARLQSAHLGTGTEAVSQLVAAMLTNSSSSFVCLYMSHFEAESLSGGLASQNQHRGEFGFSCDMFTSLSVGVRTVCCKRAGISLITHDPSACSRRF